MTQHSVAVAAQQSSNRTRAMIVVHAEKLILVQVVGRAANLAPPALGVQHLFIPLFRKTVSAKLSTTACLSHLFPSRRIRSCRFHTVLTSGNIAAMSVPMKMLDT
jgi:hypothetical protein